MSKELNWIKRNCGYDPSDIKWIDRGGTLAEYFGQEVIRVDFKKEGDQWKSVMGKALLIGGKEYDPMTESYILVWKDPKDYSLPEDQWEIKETRIVPPGFSYGNPEESCEMTRFIPYSTHIKKIEAEALFTKLEHFFKQEAEEDKAMDLSSLEQIAKSRDRERLLGNVFNIAVTIQPVDEDKIYYFRLGNISVNHQVGTSWKITAENLDKTVKISCQADTIDSKTTFYMMLNGKQEARVKFLDLFRVFNSL